MRELIPNELAMIIRILDIEESGTLRLQFFFVFVFIAINLCNGTGHTRR